MRSLYFYTAIIAFGSGVAWGTYQVVPLPVVGWLALLGFVLAAGSWRTSHALARLVLLLGSVAFIAVAVGLLRWQFVEPVTSAGLDRQVETETTLQGVVVREPDQRESTTHVYIETDDGLVLAYASRYVDVAYGDRVVVTGELAVPTAFTTDFGRTFDYSLYLKAKGVGYVMYRPEVEVVAAGQGHWFLETLYWVKVSFMHQLERVLPEPQAGLSEGLLLGVKQALGEYYETVFRTTGITHIVVLSGYNIMLVVAFFMYVLAYVLPFRARLVVGVLAIATFALLVGLSATVLRASVMAGLLLFMRFTSNNYHLVRALCLAAVIMLLVNPYLLVADVGFQLSFMATLGLILGGQWLSTHLTFLPTFGGMREFFAATVVTQVAVLPLLMFHIGEVSLVSVLTNVLVLPMVPVAMLFTFIVGLVSYVSFSAAMALGLVATISLSYILWVAELLSSVPFAAVTVLPLSWWHVFLYYIIGVVGWWYWQRRQQHLLPRPKIHTRTEFAPEWVIEEEREVAGELRSPATDTPVFFR